MCLKIYKKKAFIFRKSLHRINTENKNMKATILHKNDHTNIIILDPDLTPVKCKENLKCIYTSITLQYLRFRKNNKVTNTITYDIHLPKQALLRHVCKKLA